MKSAVFVVPFALESTMRFLSAAVRVPDVKFGVITQERPERIPPEIRARLTALERVDNALDPDQLERGVRAVAVRAGGRVDSILAILEQLQEPVAAVRERLGIRGMDLATARNFRDKARMKDLLREHDLPCARHALATDVESARAFARSSGFPLVVKPPDGAGAKNTFRVDDERALDEALRAAPPRRGAPVLLEEFVLGTEHSFDSVTIGGEPLFHSISRYTPTPLEVMESYWIQWCVMLPRDISTPEYDDIRTAGSRALKALGMVAGMTHMEWFRRPDGSLAISEVAARPPGAQFTSLLSYAHDRDFYAAWAETCVHERFDPPERRYACGAAYLRGQGKGRVAGVRGLSEVAERLGDLVVEAKVPQAGQPSATSYEGEGYVIVRHPETEVVEKALGEIVRTLQVEIE